VFCMTILDVRAQTGWTWTELSPMSEPVSNNAVTAAMKDGIMHVYSFMGIDSTKIWSGIHLKAFRYNTQSEVWDTVAPVPDTLSRIGASASTVQNKIYIIGGYHVDSSLNEISSNRIFIYNPDSNSYSEGVNIPIPIDDHVHCVWRDSLIYVITGWSDITNANMPNVQIYNPALDGWSVGTATPNNNIYKAFGASGVIIGDTIYYFGGAASVIIPEPFPAQNYLRKGVIDPLDPTQIIWSDTILDSSLKGYRMASTSYGNKVFWIGGSDVTYNYDGIAYNSSGGVNPLARILTYDSESITLVENTGSPFAVMDLRGIASIAPNKYIIAGGMDSGQVVNNKTYLLEYATATGINNQYSIPSTRDQLKIYPNPANEYLTVNFPSQYKNVRYGIYDLTGRKIANGKISSSKNSIGLNHLAKGMYMLCIEDGKHFYYRKFVK